MNKCEICNDVFKSMRALTIHIKEHHNIDRGKYILQTKYNNITPTCSCGCGQIMIYNRVLDDFPKYNKQHLKKINENKTYEQIWGKADSPKRREAISKGLKKGWEEGKYDHRLNKLKQPRTEEVKKKISKVNTGKKHTQEYKDNVSKRRTGTTHTDETREKMSQTHKQKWITGDIGDKKHYTSKLENHFEKIISKTKIKLIPRFYTPDIKAFYDFRIKNTNILIECDGDFWHCNPLNFPEPKYVTQKYNLERDKTKNQWAKDNGYILLRFWEHDINNNPEKIITEIKKYL